MKRLLIGMVVLIGLASGGWWCLHITSTDSEEPVQPSPLQKDSKTAVGVPVSRQSGDVAQNMYYVKPAKTPAGWEHFYDVSQMERLKMVTEQISNQGLEPELYAFFKAELYNHNNMNIIRNNMAEAMVMTRNANNRHPAPELHEAFITMLEDETEDPVWRDYCIQFLSAHLANSSDPKRVKEIIARYSEGNGTLAGTAMVQMAFQDEQGGMKVEEGFDDRLETQLENPKVDPATKLSIIGIMGKRGDAKHLPLIRKYAKQNDDAGLKRVAIAALGTIGAKAETASQITADDRVIVTNALSHRNEAVQLAAKGALKKLSAN